jgi:hypothetical protein
MASIDVAKRNAIISVSMEAASQKEKRNGLVLTEDDIDIFRLVLEHRFLRREALQALTGRTGKPMHRRLFKLQRGGYLTTLIRLPRQKFVYGLTAASIAELVASGAATPDLLDERLRTHELTELFLRHEMMIVDIHVAMNLASAESPLRLVKWQEGRALWDSVAVIDQGIAKNLPIRPDAFFTLEDSRRPEGKYAHFALEADRSTANHTRFADKIRAYWRYIEEGLHEKKFGVKRFRVLTITLTAARAENLSALVRALLPERSWKYFFFGSLQNFSIANPSPIFDEIWISPRTPGRQRLVPEPIPLQKNIEMVERG